MNAFERQTLEKERDRYKAAIRSERDAIAKGSPEIKEFFLKHAENLFSRREHLLELQSKLSAVESRLASEELSV